MNNILSFTKGFFQIISEIQANKKSERTFKTPCSLGMDISLGTTAEIEKLFCHFKVSLDEMRVFPGISHIK